MGAVSIAFYVGLTLVSENVLADSIAARRPADRLLLRADRLRLRLGVPARPAQPARRARCGSSCRCWAGSSCWSSSCSPASSTPTPTTATPTLFGVGGVFLIGIGSLLLGVLLMVVYGRVAPAFFRGQTLLRGTGDLLLEPDDPRD